MSSVRNGLMAIAMPLLVAVGAVGVPASAHHSFAVFFDPTKEISVKGKVVAFRFTNPHGTIVLDVPGANGTSTRWHAETNAPVVLTRRGWTRSIIKPGDTITIEGWGSRDGKPYLRLRRALDANGKLIGNLAFGPTDE